MRERERTHVRERDLNLLLFPFKNKSMFTLNKAASVREFPWR